MRWPRFSVQVRPSTFPVSSSHVFEVRFGGQTRSLIVVAEEYEMYRGASF